MNKKITFEKGMSRLDEIVDKMTNSTITLDESLSLYEEADKLIGICSGHLSTAEQKIEMLMKNRAGEVILDKNSNYTVKPL